MIKLKGEIRGDKTHDVGYRVFLLTKAMDLGIERFRASNTFENDVQAVMFYLEADQTAINKYKDFINSNFPTNADVTEVSFEDYSGYVTSISDYMHLIQVEQLNKGIPAILSIDKKQGQMLEKQDSMLEKQDSMLEKQDATIDILKSVKEDTSALREDTSALREDISMARKDTKDELYEKYEYLSREITDMKFTLSEIKTKVL